MSTAPDPSDPKHLAELSERAAAFVDEVLIPHEVTAELAGGPLPVATQREIAQRALEHGLHGGLHLHEHGGAVLVGGGLEMLLAG